MQQLPCRNFWQWLPRVRRWTVSPSFARCRKLYGMPLRVGEYRQRQHIVLQSAPRTIQKFNFRCRQLPRRVSMQRRRPPEAGLPWRHTRRTGGLSVLRRVQPWDIQCEQCCVRDPTLHGLSCRRVSGRFEFDELPYRDFRIRGQQWPNGSDTVPCWILRGRGIQCVHNL